MCILYGNTVGSDGSLDPSDICPVNVYTIQTASDSKLAMPKVFQGSNHTYSMSSMDCTGIHYSSSKVKCFVSGLDASFPCQQMGLLCTIIAEMFHGR